MTNLFEKETFDHLIERLEKLKPDAARQWGKMNISQMLAHCAEAFEVSTGKRDVKRLFIGKLLGRFFKKDYVSNNPLPMGSPTHPSFVIKEEREFNKEKERLKNFIIQFHTGGKEKVTRADHAFFGKLTPEEWSKAMYKHLDHHFRQFNS